MSENEVYPNTAPNDLLLYVDTSALLKLSFVAEETDALHACLQRWPHRVSHALVRLEVLQAAALLSSSPSIGQQAERVVASVALLSLTDEILFQASQLVHHRLEPLLTLHLAAALSLGPHLGAMITYDLRLAAAAATEGVRVLQPGTRSSTEAT